MSFVATTTSQLPARAVRPVAARPAMSVRTVRPAARVVKVRAEPSDAVEEAVKTAQEVCKDNENTKECINAWDVVEEVSANASHKRDAAKSVKKDPLEEYCEDAPDADECRVYED